MSRSICWKPPSDIVFATPPPKGGGFRGKRLLRDISSAALTTKGTAAARCGESELTRLFRQGAAQSVCDEETRAWLEGIKRLELRQGLGDYEMTVRQAAAVALRKRCGGALYACGLCLDMLREGIVC